MDDSFTAGDANCTLFPAAHSGTVQVCDATAVELRGKARAIIIPSSDVGQV